MRKCSIKNCNKTEKDCWIFTKNCKFKKELCQKHYDRLRYSKGIFKRNMQDNNEIKVYKKYCVMNLYDKLGNVIAVTKFDREFLSMVKPFKWGLAAEHGLFYARTGVNKKQYNKTVLKLHQLILPCKKPLMIDHKNNNGLDNRKSNLRIVTNQGNAENRKDNKNHIGVTWYKRLNKWQSRVTVNKKRIYLGVFRTKKEAVKARQEIKNKYNIF